MKHLLLFFASFLSWGAFAQTTFNVDMTCAPEFDNVFVTGPWCGWCANDVYNTMTDPDGDGIYTVVLDETVTGTIEYKYAINGFADQEQLVNDMVEGATCAPVTDFSGYANRLTEQFLTTNDVYGTCDGTCNDIPPVAGGEVLFRVDMSEYTGSYAMVNLNGPFNGWCGSCAPMTDDDGDLVYELLVTLDAGVYEYRFTLDGWTASEEFTDGDPCTSTIDGYVNRTFEVFEGTDAELDVVCYNSCEACGFAPTPGCADEGACNYNADATEDDGSCEYDSCAGFGCTDIAACNYDQMAMTDDGSCLYPGDACDDGIDMTVNDVITENCSCFGDSIVIGCTEPSACNYEEEAFADDGSCEYLSCQGCTDEAACNYDAEALIDDGSCGADCDGCTDTHAVNFDPEAIEDDGSCEFWSPGCDACQSNFDFGDAPFGVSPDPSLGQSFTDGHLGLPYTDAWHVLVPPTFAGFDSAYPPQLAVDSVIVMDDMVIGSGEYIGVVFTDTTTMENFHAGDLGLSIVLNNQGDSPNPTTLLGGNQYCALLSGTPTRAGIYRVSIGMLWWSTIFTPFNVPYVFDNFMLTIDDAGEGCTDPFACNYVNALVDDGSCLYPGDPCDDCNSGTTTDILNNSCQCVGGNGFAEGCTDVNACNYDPNAVVDDGSCWQSLGDAPALLIGTWKLSPEAGAIAIGPEPGSTEWYSAEQGWQNPTPEGENIDFQTDDRWTFTPEGEFIYDNNGSTMNPFDGYFETPMTVVPTAYALEAGAGLNGNDVFTVGNMNTEVAEICGWMGVWDSGPTYTIVELTQSRLVLHALQQNDSCTNPIGSGYFTLIFERVSELYSNCYTEGCTDADAVNFDPFANLDDGTCDYDCPPNVQLQQADLFFSEYVEGWANNKALEIYNPTLEYIDLSDYQIERYANGAASSADNQKVTLSGMLAPQDVVVCVLDKRDPDGVDFESPVWDELAEKADLWLCPVYDENNAMYYNGNDAMVLRKISTNSVLDVIGKVGEDPGDSGWAGLTQNHTLIRKPFVAQGDVNAVDDFMVVDEWIAIPWSTEPTNTLDVVFENLGLHGYCYEDMEVVEGCMDLGAVNFDPMANMDDGSCVFFAEDCTTLGQEEWLNYESGAYPVEGVYVTEGAQINESFVIHLASTFVDPISGAVLSVMSFEPTAINGLPNGVFASSTLQSMTPNDQQCISLSGVTYDPGSHQLEIVGELTISLFGAPYSLGEVTVVQTLIVLPNTEGTFGCTYSYAANFNPLATMDDGSCVIAACTDPEACNYLSFATVDDGSCTYGQQAAEGCQFDSNDDGLIGSSDLLDFLTAFGIECE